ncbi:MAG: alpha/beta hydrolase [Rhodothermales bacterium]|nr:alpha/beta hydrolase [Rhodothermales bacterium]MBO6780527.1 alpha/beta hydrolase [Rhodothermales bacterium]
MPADAAVTVQGLTLHLRIGGQGPGLLLLHGFPTSSADWDPIWSALTRDFRVLAFDFPGLGRSEKPRRHVTIPQIADIALELMDRHGVPCAHMLAHDLGNTVALELLHRDRDWQSLVMLNGGIVPGAYRPRPIQKLLAGPAGPLVARVASERLFRRNMHRIFGPHTAPSEQFLHESWQTLLAGGGRASLPYVIRYLHERKRHADRWMEPLRHPPVPMQLICGVHDPVSGEAVADAVEALESGVHVTRLDVGHYPQVENPEQVVDAFRAFHSRLR